MIYLANISLINLYKKNLIDDKLHKILKLVSHYKFRNSNSN